jgi:Cu-Zn family superoxide dismutase
VDRDGLRAGRGRGSGSSGGPGAGGARAKSLPPEDAGSQGGKTAAATLEARSGSTLSGTARFEQGEGQLKVTIEIANAAPGGHGVHIHEIGDCSAPDAKSAGGHFNPAGSPHGSPAAQPHHAGDLWNIHAGGTGTGSLTLISRDLTLDDGPNAIRGRAIVVHAKPDDFKTQPSGASGARVGCGVIR